MNKDKIIKILITTFIILIPILDMLRTTGFKDVEVFGIALIELINICLIGGALLLTFAKVSLKKLLFLGGYLVIVAIYIVLHYKNIIQFDTNIFALAEFSFIRETFYILRVYVLPLMLLFILFNNRDIFNKEYYFKLVKYLIMIICFSIIILDIFKLSYISYSANKAHVVNNLFDYFLYDGNYRKISARGFFDSANELSAILFMLMPINIYLLYKEHTKFNVLLYVSQFIAMILLGTRTSAYGALLISVVAFVFYVVLVLLKREKQNEFFNISFIVSLLACSAFLFISPFMLGRVSEGTPDFSVKNTSAYDDIEKTDIKNIDKLIEKYKSEYLINELFLEVYPIQNDREFWLSIIKRDKSLNNDSRKIKTDILNRIMQRNDNPNDKFLGMGYTLNFLDLERDYYYQYYIFGILGVLILIGPYFIIIGFIAYKSLRYFNKNFNLKTVLCFMSVALGLLIAYYSGHVFGWVGPMMILNIMFGLIGYVVYENNKKKTKKVKS